MSQPHSTHYILELQLKDDKKKWYVYAQGISPLFYNLQGIQSFQLYKQWMEGTEFKKQRITYRLLRFQQRFRERLRLKNLALKHLRQLETGEVQWSTLIHQR